MKKCSQCEEIQDDSAFPVRMNHGKVYQESRCKECKRKNQRGKPKNKNVPSRSKVGSREYKLRWRRSPETKASVILQSCRDADRRKHNASCDLDKDFVQELIDGGCSYCDEREIGQMTLDRIDNEKGHRKGNVIAACYRCNMTRSDMPYEAWLIVASAMKIARENGLFGDWRKEPTNRRQKKEG